MTSERKNGYAGKRVLITGGTGYLATNLTDLLKDLDCYIVRLARSEARFSHVNKGRARIKDIVGDVRERTTWDRALEGIDIVFHFAAQTSTYVANSDPRADLENNVVPMVHLLEVCRKYGGQPIVLFSGTVTEAGVPMRLPVDETHPDNPVTIYDLHKLMAEDYLKYFTKARFVRGATLRLANVYGPGPKSSNADRGVLNLMMNRAVAGEPLAVYGRGDQLRDYVYVEDVARAFAEAALNIEKINGSHFVIGSGKGFTIADAMKLVAERAARKTGRHCEVVHCDPPGQQSPIEARNFVADSSGFMSATGWQPRWSLAEGIDRTLDTLL